MYNSRHKLPNGCEFTWCLLATGLPLVLITAILLYEWQTEALQGEAGQLGCAAGYFPCGNSTKCIAQEFQCDNVSHCPNGEDESYELCQDNEGYVKDMFRLQVFKSRNSSLLRHVCELEVYPSYCTCTLATRVRCSANHLQRIPSNISSAVTRLLLQSNNIDKIVPGSLKNYDNLDMIHLERNNISDLEPYTFQGAVSLEKLFLTRNLLTRIRDRTFSGLKNLTWLFIDHNRLHTLEPDAFVDLDNLQVLMLSHNMLTLSNPEIMVAPSNLIILDLEANHIKEIGDETFRRQTNLHVLILKRNGISKLSPSSFAGTEKLTHLDLSHNEIMTLPGQLFARQRQLSKLLLVNNTRIVIEDGVFSQTHELISLNLSGVSLPNIRKEIFLPLKHLHFVYFKSFQHCHYAPMARVCWPKGDGISSLRNLLDRVIHRVAIWIVATVTCVGNVFVLVCRLVFVDERNVQGIFIRNLCVADFMMGVYLVIIAVHDAIYRDRYNEHALRWMHSWGCQATGALAMMSCEVTLLLLTFMSVERFVTIAFPYRPRCLTHGRGITSLVFIWLVGIALALLPMATVDDIRQFYGSNGVCFPLHVHDAYLPGWQYSAFVFIGLNLCAMIVIAVSYLGMFVSVVRTRQQANSCLKRDMSFAKRFFLIVITDAVCWIPVVVIKLLALSNVYLSDQVYAWLTIFVLPINSAINPLIYSLTTTRFRRRLSDAVHTKSRDDANNSQFLMTERNCPSRVSVAYTTCSSPSRHLTVSWADRRQSAL